MQKNAAKLFFGSQAGGSGQLRQYLLALPLSESLRSAIEEMREKFSVDYRCPQATAGAPLIPLILFSRSETVEPELVNQFETLAGTLAPRVLSVNDFASLPTHTIYLNVYSGKGSRRLSEAFKPMQSVLKQGPDQKPFFIPDLRIPLARKLLPWQYEQGWLRYRHTHFRSSFMADRVQLFKKTEGESFRQVRTFSFQVSRPPENQGSLF